MLLLHSKVYLSPPSTLPCKTAVQNLPHHMFFILLQYNLPMLCCLGTFASNTITLTNILSAAFYEDLIYRFDFQIIPIELQGVKPIHSNRTVIVIISVNNILYFVCCCNFQRNCNEALKQRGEIIKKILAIFDELFLSKQSDDGGVNVKLMLNQC